MARLLGGLSRSASVASDHAVAAGYLSGWRLVRRLPERGARRLFARIADEVYRRDGGGVRRLRQNLAVVRPELTEGELEELTHAAVRSYLRYWCESFRLPSWPVDDLVRRTRVIGEDRLRDAYAAGNGVVVPLPHMGNWDWAGAWATATGMPLMTVAERLKPERLFEEFLAYRTGLGMEILPLTGDDATFRRLVDWLTAGGLVCLLADRDLSRGGVEVRLCGQRASMPRGPAVLALRTGAPLLPATLRYPAESVGEPGGLEITIHPEVPADRTAGGVGRMMQAVADVFTEAIRAHPQDWHMMQRVFLQGER